MDRFDLNWPNAEAEFFTDGWRCRIVWRQKGKRNHSGIGGTIENSNQCVRRAAESLEGAPYLLSALKARGHEQLAGQIESVAAGAIGERRLETTAPSTARVARKPIRSERRESFAVLPKVAKTTERTDQQKQVSSSQASRSEAQTENAWLSLLHGNDASTPVDNRRAKTWLELEPLRAAAVDADVVFFLKTPAPKGKREWVLKRTWPEEPKRKAEYVAAEHFRGIASYLVSAGAKSVDIEGLLAITSAVANEELVQAATAWRETVSEPGGAH